MDDNTCNTAKNCTFCAAQRAGAEVLLTPTTPHRCPRNGFTRDDALYPLCLRTATDRRRSFTATALSGSAFFRRV